MLRKVPSRLDNQLINGSLISPTPNNRTAQNLVFEMVHIISNTSMDGELSDALAQHGQLLCDTYNAPHRVYHSIYHIAHLFTMAKEFKPFINDWKHFVAAILYHDFVYELDEAVLHNEQNSAKQAEKFLRELNLHEFESYVVEDMILNSGNAFDVQLFHDLDHLVLASSKTDYQTYTSAIRQEYGKKHSQKNITLGRLDFCRKLLKNGPIYRTHICQMRFEKNAYRNLCREMEELLAEVETRKLEIPVA
tara:strand:- start:2098 stop:2844 length:747 start_codon:yes stop_codon:yes gene_type:complete